MSDSTTTPPTASDFAGMQPTGRRIAGGTADLVELDDGEDEGLRHTALVFHERYREHDALRTGIEIARGFMEFPMVSGLVELSHWLPEQGTFIYPTGTAWTATEVLRTLRDSGGVTVPSRSILEAAYLSAMILQEASETGPQQGVFAHGSMTPSRVLFKADGQVQIIGYGLPAVDLMMVLEDPDNVPNEDTFRYAPPERMAGLAEDGDSDIYSLCLVLWELLSGEPVYDGTIDEMREMAKRGDADKRVTRSAPKQRKVPDGLADLFVRALNPDPEARPTPLEFVQGIEKLMTENPDGVTLEQVMDKVREGSKRGRSLAAPPKGSEAVGGRGRPVGPQSVPKGQLRAAGAGIMSIGVVPRGAPPGAPGAAPPADIAAPEAGNRWGKVARGAGAKDEGDARDKLRARLRKGDGGAEAAPAAPTGSGSVEDARERLRNRLKGKEEKAAAPAGAAPAEAAAPVPTDDARARLRGRLKPGSTPEPKVEAAAEPAAAASDAAPAAPADPREALRERLKARSGGAATEPVPAEPKAGDAPPATAPDAPVAPAEPAPAAPVDPRAALREKLRQRAGDQPTGAPAAPPAASPVAPPAAAAEPVVAAPVEPAAPAAAAVPAPAAEPAAEDPREALRRKLRERAQTKE